MERTGPTWSELAEELRAALLAWDPLGVGDIPQARDEYDCLLGPILTRLQQGFSAEEIGAFLKRELAGHFGINPDPHDPEEFAVRLVAWFEAKRGPQ